MDKETITTSEAENLWGREVVTKAWMMLLDEKVYADINDHGELFFIKYDWERAVYKIEGYKDAE